MSNEHIVCFDKIISVDVLGVSNGLCEHTSTVFSFASMSIDKSEFCEQQALFKKLPSLKKRACKHL